MTKLVFHLGDKKTGSTAIQTTLGLGAWTCDSVKLTYPVSGGFSHIALAKSLQTKGRLAVGAAKRAAIADHFAEVTNRINLEQPDVALISAEHFEEVDPVVLRDAIQTFLPDYAETATFIAYVRPHADRLASSYSERIKQGIFWGSIDDLHKQMLTAGKLKYMPRFSKWREVFGDRFELRPMVRDLLYRQDVVADVLQFILKTEDFQILPVETANESVSLENLALMRRFQLELRDGAASVLNHQAAFGWSLARRMNKSDLAKGTKVQLHRSLAEDVLKHYRADAEALDKAFFKGTPMTDAILAAPGKAVAEPQSIMAESHYSPRELQLVDIFIDQIASLTRADPKLWANALREQHRMALKSGGPHAEEDGDDRMDGDTSEAKRKDAGVGRRSFVGARGAGGKAGARKAGAGGGKAGGGGGGGKRANALAGAGKGGPGRKGAAGKAGPGKAGGGKGGANRPGRGKGPKALASPPEE